MDIKKEERWDVEKKKKEIKKKKKKYNKEQEFLLKSKYRQRK